MCSTCGTNVGAVCLCSQLTAGGDDRSRTLWVGSVLPEHSEEDVRLLFSERKDSGRHDVESVCVRRNAFRGMGYALVVFVGAAPAPFEHEVFEIRGAQWEQNSVVVPVVHGRHECEREGSGMPSLQAQLEPLTETQLRDRLVLLSSAADPVEEQNAYRQRGRLGKKMFLKNRLVDVYRSGGAKRTMRKVAGEAVALDLCAALLAELKGDVWPTGPKKKTRKGVDAEAYMVLGQVSSDAAFKVGSRHTRLWAACMNVLGEGKEAGDWRCTSIALSRGFRGSPHVDSKDSSYQYAISLGEFEGGELCVESGAGGREIVVVNTKEKLAKVDGRFVHFVKDWTGKERFSVIFFCCDPLLRRAPERAVY